jgi:hypothetical protein
MHGPDGAGAWNDRLLRALGALAAGASLATLRMHETFGGSISDAILDALSLPDPSNLQSENVQEGWN